MHGDSFIGRLENVMVSLSNKDTELFVLLGRLPPGAEEEKDIVSGVHTHTHMAPPRPCTATSTMPHHIRCPHTASHAATTTTQGATKRAPQELNKQTSKQTNNRKPVAYLASSNSLRTSTTDSLPKSSVVVLTMRLSSKLAPPARFTTSESSPWTSLWDAMVGCRRRDETNHTTSNTLALHACQF